MNASTKSLESVKSRETEGEGARYAWMWNIRDHSKDHNKSNNKNNSNQPHQNNNRTHIELPKIE